MADYDNSILYNDFIIDEIIKLMSDKNVMIIYTSDHGQDIFYTSPGYMGHGIMSKETSRKAGSNVPFIFYMSDEFNRRHPGIKERIKLYTDSTFNNNYLINTILEIAGYSIKGYDVTEQSLFKGELYNHAENRSR